MIRLDMEQGSAAWLEVRRGIPTASQFYRILTPKTQKPSSQAGGYLLQLLTEWALGVNQDEDVSEFMQRGHDLEAKALAYYELERDVAVERPGFILRDDRRVGCSPDGLIVGQPGGLELKVPSAAVHLGYLLNEDPTRYAGQVQGGLWLAEREWWDFESYHGTLPPLLLRFPRDETFIRALAGAVDEFLGRLDEAKAKLTALGVTPAAAPAIQAQVPGELAAAFDDVLA